MTFWKKLTERPSAKEARETGRDIPSRLEAVRTAPALTWSTVDEARKCLAEIRLKEQELRLIKTEIRVETQGIRAEYTFKRAMVKSNRWHKGFSTDRAIQRENLTRHQAKELTPHERLAHEADELIQHLERTKLEINRWLAAQK